ncbi:MAG: GGDEF domain-containing protein [Alphaproteobacteria bacterium]|nr:GGDEF domain-containing protein [Alphaproteobacteria bacterium]
MNVRAAAAGDGTIHAGGDSARTATATGVVVLRLREFDLLAARIGEREARRLRDQAARRMRATVGGRGTMRRTGEGEFAALDLPPGTAATVAAEVSEAFSAPFSREGRNHYLRIAIGVAEGAAPVEHVLADAVLAGRAARAGEIRSYEPGLRSAQEREMALEMALRDAIVARSADLDIAYQPIFDVRARRLVGFEALARWTSPELGEVSPACFIPIAENAGLAPVLGERICELAAATSGEVNRARRMAGEAPLFMSINLSALQLAEPKLVAVMAAILDKTGGDPSHIRFELTESVLLSGRDGAITIIEGLRALGPAVTLDDFGTGYSSFSYLHELPVDGIKLGRSFIQQVPESRRATEVVGALIRLAHDLRLSVVAEGVETESTWRALQEFDCDYVQGLLFGAPLTKARILHPSGIAFPDIG